MVMLTNRIFAQAGFTLRGGPWHLGDFRNTFLTNVDEDQKKSHHLSAWPLAGTVPYYGKSGPGYCQYLNCRGDASPHRELASPNRGLVSFHRELSAV